MINKLIKTKSDMKNLTDIKKSGNTKINASACLQ